MNILRLTILINTVGVIATSIQGEANEMKFTDYDGLENQIIKCGFNSEKISLKKVYDLKKNNYVIGEQGEDGYFIYSVDLKKIVEYSNKASSPYLNYNRNLIYSGPGEYFVENDNTYYSILENVEYQKNRVSKVPAISTYSRLNSESKNLQGRSVTLSQYKVKHDEFFTSDCYENCGYFDGGYCRFIDLGLLIGYQDKYHNDDIIDDKYYENYSTKTGLKNYDDSISKYLYDLNPKDSTTSKHIKTVLKQYAKEKNVSVDYISRWTPFFSTNDILDKIKNDNPVELFGNFKYESSTSSGNTGIHAIVAYELDCKDLDSWEFKCHLCWGWRNEVVVTEYVIGSIFSFSCK